LKSIPRVSLTGLEDTDGSVVRSGNELLSGGRVVDVHNGSNVVLENVEGTVHLAHVEDVDVVVFVRGSKVERLHRVPANLVVAESSNELGEGRAGTEVVEDQGSVTTGGGKDGSLRLVELDGIDGVGTPLEGGDRLLSVPVPDVDNSRSCSEVAVVTVVRNGVESLLSEVGSHGGVVSVSVKLGVPELHSLVGGARK
jgi:hypothetical protein